MRSGGRKREVADCQKKCRDTGKPVINLQLIILHKLLFVTAFVF